METENPGYRDEFTAFMHLSDHSLRQIDDAYVRSLNRRRCAGCRCGCWRISRRRGSG